jgi:pimeloyl-ACP methyl ester carboxylesterase
MKIYFIHGFGENESIFDKIAPSLPSPQVFINVWDLLGTAPREGLNVIDFAKEIVSKYNVTVEDVVIGHSMGGWIAYHVKQYSGCRVVQIGSWTEFDRIIAPIKNAKVIYWLTRNGLYMNRFVLWFFGLAYKGKPSEWIFRDSFERLIVSNREAVVNQMKLMFEPVKRFTMMPELRIHARKDVVIRHPKEPFHEVPGDHFTLITHPETVIEPILEFLLLKTR